MKILIACEYSGIVRDAFTAKGHDAISCDLLPTESPGKHYQGSVFDILDDGFDMAIAHPPCPFLCVAGNAYYNVLKYGLKAIDRHKKRAEAIEFFYRIYSADIEKIAIENPKGIMSNLLRKPDQIIHPYYFGDNYMKETHLWLKNLLPLVWHEKGGLFPEISNEVDPEVFLYNSKKTKSGKSRYSKYGKMGSGHGKERSLMPPGIAKAMAEQWG